MKSPEKVYLIDTNVILRYLLSDHKQFSPKAESFIQDISKGLKKAVIPAVVVVECIYVLEKFYKVSRPEIVETVGSVLNLTGMVNPDKSQLIEALLTYKDHNIDIVDCILAACSSPDKPVVTFDRDLEKIKAFTEKL